MYKKAVVVMLCLVVFNSTAFAGELKASWYSNASLIKEGTWKNGEQRMANGKRFDENALTCAARIYPLGTVLRITNVRTSKCVIVTVTDKIGKRFATSRIDLTKKAFSRIANLSEGIINIKVEVVK
jgi:rare lipoprotein A